jgi:hypothetical protein
MHLSARPLLSLLLIAAACSSSEPPEDPPITGWAPLITKPWSLAPGAEITSDITLITLEEDILAGGIRPIAPPGTHHTLLARGTGGLDIIYASGVGTNELMFPAGTGLRLPAGSLVGLQLHVFNTGDGPLSGTSGVEVFRVDPATAVEDADVVLAGPTELAIPPGGATLRGTCTVTERQTLFALFPHMHQLGTHLKTTVTTGGVARVIHDAPYMFEHQPFIPLEPIVLEPGDTVTTECTWTNPGTSTVTWGESSTTEMCFSIMYRTPAIGDRFCGA